MRLFYNEKGEGKTLGRGFFGNPEANGYISSSHSWVYRLLTIGSDIYIF